MRVPQAARSALTLLGVVLCAGALAGRDWGGWTPPTLLALGLLLLGTRWLILRSPPRAAFWAEGFAVLEGATVVCRGEYDVLASVRVDDPAHAVVITTRDASATEIPLVFFGTRARADHFVATVNTHLAADRPG